MQNGATALILAAQMGHTDLVTQLLERGADVSAASEVRTLHTTHNFMILKLPGKVLSVVKMRFSSSIQYSRVQ
jgi:ankyrin repeat protein